MPKTKFILLCGMAIVLLASCEKPEELWALEPSGKETVATVNMGENYETTIFFKLETGKTTLRNYDEWDLAFATAGTDFYITMNGGKSIQVYNTHDTDFFKTTYSALITSPWQWDNPSGDPDSTAFGTWLDAKGASKKEIYIIDLGPLASPRYQKMQLTGFDAGAYHFRYAGIDNNNANTTTVAKDSFYNFSYFSFFTSGTTAVEPSSKEWDLVFTKYRNVYYDMDPVTPYAVTGVLINTRSVTVAETRTLTFEDITYEKASQLMLTRKADEIGFDWKFYDLNGSGKYILDSKKIYIIKDPKGAFYKLKFIGFYTDQGLKGSPKFIYQRL